MADGVTELLFAMSKASHAEAEEHLSEAGREILGMLQAAELADIPLLDAYVQARATADLSDHDHQVLQTYLSRMSLIDAFWPKAEREETPEELTARLEQEQLEREISGNLSPHDEEMIDLREERYRREALEEERRRREEEGDG